MTYAEKIERLLFPLTSSGCMEFPGSRTKKGYGSVNVSGKTTQAHRYAYYVHIGNPSGGVVMHTCDNPGCVNPDHLTLGSQKDNMDDMVQKGRAPHGERSGSVKMSEDDVYGIFNMRNLGMTHASIARVVGVSQQQVSRILLGERWSHLGLSSKDLF